MEELFRERFVTVMKRIPKTELKKGERSVYENRKNDQ